MSSKEKQNTTNGPKKKNKKGKLKNERRKQTLICKTKTIPFFSSKRGKTRPLPAHSISPPPHHPHTLTPSPTLVTLFFSIDYNQVRRYTQVTSD
jgi:hypothetical protein